MYGERSARFAKGHRFCFSTSWNHELVSYYLKELSPKCDRHVSLLDNLRQLASQTLPHWKKNVQYILFFYKLWRFVNNSTGFGRIFARFLLKRYAVLDVWEILQHLWQKMELWCDASLSTTVGMYTCHGRYIRRAIADKYTSKTNMRENTSRIPRL